MDLNWLFNMREISKDIPTFCDIFNSKQKFKTWTSLYESIQAVPRNRLIQKLSTTLHKQERIQ